MSDISSNGEEYHSICCVAVQMCNTNNCPTGIATQKVELRKKLHVDNSARKLQNLFTASVELMNVMACTCGHDVLSKFNKEDLATWHREVAYLSGVNYSVFKDI